MTDRMTPAQRSRTMARVRSKDTAPELEVRKALHAKGYRFRLHRRDLPGNPDIVLPLHRLVVFVHGCFWHGHDCPRGERRPVANSHYWGTKLDRNKARDRAARGALEAAGWAVEVIWTCEIEVGIDRVTDRLARPF